MNGTAVCCVSGVPEIVSVLVVPLSKLRPLGRVPALMTQVNGATPPVAWIVLL